MKKPLKNETDILTLINKIQEYLITVDKKIDTLIDRSVPGTKPSFHPAVDGAHLPVKPNERNKTRMMHTAICADCKKECTIPFKPSGDRPVYCQDCFSRRKVIKLSGMTVLDKPHEGASVQKPVINEIIIPEAKDRRKKKAVKIKKPIAKKKPKAKKK